MTGQQVLEEVYGIGLNPTLPYGAQLEPLAASGELSNKNQTNAVLFKLCELLDEQAKEIKTLKDDRKEIVKQMITLEQKLTPDVQPAPDPTQPITDASL
jgi:Tfp pilus assembly protein PilN